MEKHEVYNIEGMSCAACSSAVERVTRRIEGVIRSDVNLTTNKMTIDYDDEKVQPDLIVTKVENAGFGCKKKEPENTAAVSGKNTGVTGRASARKESLEKERKEIKTQKINLSVSLAFVALLLYVSMGSMAGAPLPQLFNMKSHPVNFALLELLCALPVMYLGRRFYLRGFKALFHGNPDMDTLVSLGSSVAFIYSLAVTFLLEDNPHLVHSLFYESAAVVVAFVSTGKFLEGRSKEKTKAAITSLVELVPETAFVVQPDGFTVETPVENITAGMVILARAGDRIASDGIVEEGESGVDESMLTGESLPVEKGPGSSVTGGSINGNGLLKIRVTKVGSDTVLSKIIAFVEEAQGKKAPISRVADKVAGIFVPAVMAVAFSAAAVWTTVGILGTHGVIQLPSAWNINAGFVLRIMTSILVIACPCALGLATPTAIMVGTGLGAANGILIRSGEALETAHSIDTVVLDKTGTVTQGKPVVTDVVTAANTPEEKKALLLLAAALESSSSHPLAIAVCSASAALQNQQNVSSEKRSDIQLIDVQTVPGRGVKAVLNGKINSAGTPVFAGNAAFLQENNIDFSNFAGRAEKLAEQGKSLIYVARGAEVLGCIAVADTVKPDSAEAVKRLKKEGIHVIVLTGDNKKAADYIGAQIGADEVISQVLPQDKASVIEKLQKQGRKVMMAGDGINDAPALVQADIGAAVGNGSDVAIESGDIILMKNSLADVARAIKLSRMTIANIKENLFWAFCYNTIGIPLAAGVLYPAFGILLTPMFGALAMSLSSVCVVSNALRLRTKKL